MTQVEFDTLKTKAQIYADAYMVDVNDLLELITIDGHYWTVFGDLESRAKSIFKNNKRTASIKKNVSRMPEDAHVCDHCNGEGGKTYWPGYDCFKCAGMGWVQNEVAA